MNGMMDFFIINDIMYFFHGQHDGFFLMKNGFFMNGKMLPFLNYSELVRFSARTQLVHDDRFLASPDGH